MSQKISPAGVLLGSYGRDDLETYMFPEVKRKGKRRERLRKLDYELVWEITEMQVKVHVRAHFPNQIGPITTQLAKERRLEEHERTLTGESRSKALIRDIDITTTAGGGPRADGVNALDDDRRRGLLVDNSGPSGLQQRDGVAREYQQIGRTESPRMTSLVGAGSQLMSQSVNDSEPVSVSHVIYWRCTRLMWNHRHRLETPYNLQRHPPLISSDRMVGVATVSAIHWTRTVTDGLQAATRAKTAKRNVTARTPLMRQGALSLAMNAFAMQFPAT